MCCLLRGMVMVAGSRRREVRCEAEAWRMEDLRALEAKAVRAFDGVVEGEKRVV